MPIRGIVILTMKEVDAVIAPTQVGSMYLEVIGKVFSDYSVNVYETSLELIGRKREDEIRALQFSQEILGRIFTDFSASVHQYAISVLGKLSTELINNYIRLHQMHIEAIGRLSIYSEPSVRVELLQFGKEVLGKRKSEQVLPERAVATIENRWIEDYNSVTTFFRKQKYSLWLEYLGYRMSQQYYNAVDIILRWTVIDKSGYLRASGTIQVPVLPVYYYQNIMAVYGKIQSISGNTALVFIGVTTSLGKTFNQTTSISWTLFPPSDARIYSQQDVRGELLDVYYFDGE